MASSVPQWRRCRAALWSFILLLAPEFSSKLLILTLQELALGFPRADQEEPGCAEVTGAACQRPREDVPVWERRRLSLSLCGLALRGRADSLSATG